jgi:hypothetical protein
LLVALVLSCNKSADPAEDVIGKWRLDSIQTWMSDPTRGPQPVTIYKPSSDYYDFRSDSYLYRHFKSRYDTLPYALEKSNGVWLIRYGLIFSADTIQSLSDHSLIIMNPQGGRSKLIFSR